jgi:soluble lytic murein transglycosylase-like protein
MRMFPKVRALCQRVRRPTISVLIGMCLIAPAGAFVVYGGETAADEFEGKLTPVEIGTAQARDAVAMAWRQGVLDRERLRASKKFAARFRIPADLADDIYWAATKERIDPHLAYNLVLAESSFRSGAVSSKGAVGLTQVKPSTATWLFPGTRQVDLLSPRYNLRVGFRYLRRLLDTYGDANLALLAYNRGPARVDSLLSVGENPENGYAEYVLEHDVTRHLEFVSSGHDAAKQPEPQDSVRDAKVTSSS